MLMRRLWLLYNIDPRLMETCSNRDRYRYAAYGGIVLLVFLISFTSAVYLVYLMMFDWVLSIILGGILAWNFLNLYRLTLLTINPYDPQRGNTSIGNGATMFVRGIFLIILIAVVVKPLELRIFEAKIEPFIEIFHESKIAHFENQVLKLIDDEIARLIEDNQKYKDELKILKRQMERIGEKSSLVNFNVEEDLLLNRIGVNEKNIILLFQKRSDYLQKYSAKIKDSSNLVERIRVLVVELPWSWLFSSIMGLVLLFPILLKRFFIIDDLYFCKERDQESKLILEHYEWFKDSYQAVFEKKYGFRLPFYEAFEDAPFNRKRKKEKIKKVDEIAFRTWIEKQF